MPQGRTTAWSFVMLAAVLLAAGCDTRRAAPPPPAPLDLSAALEMGPCGPDRPEAPLAPRVTLSDSTLRLGADAAAVARLIAGRIGGWDRPELTLEMQNAARAAKGPPAALPATAPMRPWEIQFFKGNTLEMYTRQLEFFGLELGLILPDNKITYIPHPTKPKADLRTGPTAAETRPYLSWSRGDLIEADRNVARQAGLEVEDRVILCFLPAKVEQTLAELEKKHAGAKLEGVTKTRFGVRRKGEGYEFYVTEQTYQTVGGAP